jgi:hypothetical protein
VGRLHATADFIPSSAWSCGQRRPDVHRLILIDPVPDMCRTTVNVFSDTCVPVVACSEGKTGVPSGCTPADGGLGEHCNESPGFAVRDAIGPGATANRPAHP